jgi:large subunit ribosomal protein L11
MAKESIDVLIEGGKATAAPPLGPALGPLKVNIGQVVADINKKTADFKGMQVPVTVTVDTDTKEFTITVGTPPASQLIKKEAGVQKGAGNPLTDKVADLSMEQIKKIAGMKEDALLGKNVKQRVKEIMGTCQSMGVTVEGQTIPEAIKAVNSGKYDSLLN